MPSKQKQAKSSAGRKNARQASRLRAIAKDKSVSDEEVVALARRILRQVDRRQKRASGYPKQPITPYFAYLAEVRASLHEADPEASVIDVAKKAGAKWKDMSAADKKPYVQAFRKDKARFDGELAAWEKRQAAGDGSDVDMSSSAESESEEED